MMWSQSSPTEFLRGPHAGVSKFQREIITLLEKEGKPPVRSLPGEDIEHSEFDASSPRSEWNKWVLRASVFRTLVLKVKSRVCTRCLIPSSSLRRRTRDLQQIQMLMSVETGLKWYHGVKMPMRSPNQLLGAWREEGKIDEKLVYVDSDATSTCSTNRVRDINDFESGTQQIPLTEVFLQSWLVPGYQEQKVDHKMGLWNLCFKILYTSQVVWKIEAYCLSWSES